MVTCTLYGKAMLMPQQKNIKGQKKVLHSFKELCTTTNGDAMQIIRLSNYSFVQHIWSKILLEELVWSTSGETVLVKHEHEVKSQIKIKLKIGFLLQSL